MGGLMLIGMGLMKLGVFSARKDEGFYRWLLLLGAFCPRPQSWLRAVRKASGR